MANPSAKPERQKVSRNKMLPPYKRKKRLALNHARGAILVPSAITFISFIFNHLAFLTEIGSEPAEDPFLFNAMFFSRCPTIAPFPLGACILLISAVLRPWRCAGIGNSLTRDHQFVVPRVHRRMDLRSVLMSVVGSQPYFPILVGRIFVGQVVPAGIAACWAKIDYQLRRLPFLGNPKLNRAVSVVLLIVFVPKI